MDLKTIEELCLKNSVARSALANLLNTIKEEIADVRERYRNEIRECIAEIVTTNADLANAIDEDRSLFEKPRTRVFHGIRAGLRKGSGKLVIADEDKTIAAIKRRYQDDLGVLITTKEVVNKEALGNLTIGELKALGVTVVATSDTVVTKPVDGDLVKEAAALIGEKAA